MQGLQGPIGPTGIQTGPAGTTGATGEQGIEGATGAAGENGLSAYEVAVENGFVGTEQEWLESLQGPTGPAGTSLSDVFFSAQTTSSVSVPALSVIPIANNIISKNVTVNADSTIFTLSEYGVYYVSFCCLSSMRGVAVGSATNSRNINFSTGATIVTHNSGSTILRVVPPAENLQISVRSLTTGNIAASFIDFSIFKISNL